MFAFMFITIQLLKTLQKPLLNMASIRKIMFLQMQHLSKTFFFNFVVTTFPFF